MNKGRVVFGGDFVKDDSCSCAVLSVCVTNDSKVMDVIAIAQDSGARVSRCTDTSSTPQMAEFVVKLSRLCGSSHTKFDRTSTCWPLVGKTVWRNMFESRISC